MTDYCVRSQRIQPCQKDFNRAKRISTVPKGFQPCQKDLNRAKRISTVPKGFQPCQKDFNRARRISTVPKGFQPCQCQKDFNLPVPKDFHSGKARFSPCFRQFSASKLVAIPAFPLQLHPRSCSAVATPLFCWLSSQLFLFSCVLLPAAQRSPLRCLRVFCWLPSQLFLFSCVLPAEQRAPLRCLRVFCRPASRLEDPSSYSRIDISFSRYVMRRCTFLYSVFLHYSQNLDHF